MSQIYESINAVMKDIGAIGKEKRNTQQNWNFRGIDDVTNALQPALVKHKVFVVPEIVEQIREERKTAKGGVLIYSICKIKYSFFAADGSSVSAVVIGEGMDSGDKATNKAMSIAFKYACFQVFCIPTEEMIDPDESVHEPEPKKFNCSQCGAEISEKLYNRGVEKFGKAICEMCYKKENEPVVSQQKTLIEMLD